MFNRKKKSNKGFTLVELLVVIAIIGILAVVAVPTLFKQIDKSKGADISATVGTIKTATISYYADNDDVPESIDSLKSGGYLDSDPNEDFNKVQYDLKKGENSKTASLKVIIKGTYMDSESIKKLGVDLGVKPSKVSSDTELTIPLVN